MSTLAFYAQFVKSLVGVNSLTVTWDVEQITRSDGTRSALVTGGATSITIGRRGLYGYLLAAADTKLYDYVATAITAGDVDQKEIAALWTMYEADTLKLSGDGDAADNLELFFDGTGYASAGSINSVLGTVTVDTEDIADAVWDEVLSGHATAGSTGAALSASGAAGDPWEEDLPGTYASGSAGYIIGGLAVINPSTLTVSSPVAVDGDVELYAGDDYNNSDGRALEWTSSDWPDLTSATITLYLRAPDGSKFSKAGSTPVAGSGSQTVRVELTAAETATLIDWPTPSTLRLRATLAVSGRKVTLVTGVLTVAEDIS